MNMSVNSVNFTGKKEILYGLTKAAQKAKNFEYYNQPEIAATMGTSKQQMQASQTASMKAYLDMVLRDKDFEKTIQNLKKSDLNYLHNILQPEQTQYSTVMPMNKFKEAISEVITEIGRLRFTAKDAVNELYTKLGL